jgi:hypothetical protein
VKGRVNRFFLDSNEWIVSLNIETQVNASHFSGYKRVDEYFE